MKLAAFPKCFLRELCVERTMSVADWAAMAKEHLAPIGVTGLEIYWRVLESLDAKHVDLIRRQVENEGFEAPMLCASPDFTSSDAAYRRDQVELEIRLIEVAARLGAKTCRVLSGQRRPEVSVDEGIRWTVESIETLLPVAESHEVVLAMENHFKDSYWELPEFAQQSDRFLAIVSQIDSPWFGVNYDPSNTLLAGEDPVALLREVAPRVVSMHASDRRPRPGAAEVTDYSQMIHGEIGTGLIDFDSIFAILRGVGFDGWVSIEDGESGIDELVRSACYLAGTLAVV